MTRKNSFSFWQRVFLFCFLFNSKTKAIPDVLYDAAHAGAIYLVINNFKDFTTLIAEATRQTKERPKTIAQKTYIHATAMHNAVCFGIFTYLTTGLLDQSKMNCPESMNAIVWTLTTLHTIEYFTQSNQRINHLWVDIKDAAHALKSNYLLSKAKKTDQIIGSMLTFAQNSQISSSMQDEWIDRAKNYYTMHIEAFYQISGRPPFLADHFPHAQQCYNKETKEWIQALCRINAVERSSLQILPWDVRKNIYNLAH